MSNSNKIFVKEAKFVGSFPDVDLCPKPNIHEYAFIGRSNVGKSSLVNMLTGQNSLAKISSTPGKTRTINHFLINNSWYLVDLPGYGFAKLPKSERDKFTQLNQNYILERPNLVCMFVLVDSRIPPQKIDLEFLEWLGENAVPFVIVFTKVDKLSSNAWNKNYEFYKEKLSENWEVLPNIFVTSSQDGLGKEEIFNFINETNLNVKLEEIWK
jgi:GTP-binding protein